MRNRTMLPEFFENNGKVVKVHNKDNRIGWIEFRRGDATYTLNLHETELEELDE